MKKRALFLVAATMGALAVAGGVAWAATVQCPTGEDGTCDGTPNDDRITGTPDADFVRGRGGDDVLSARGGDGDLSVGGSGEDRVRGQAGSDQVFGGSISGDSAPGEQTFADSRDDVVRGGDGGDFAVAGGYGRGGRDKLYGGDGDDTVYSAQRGFPYAGDVRVNSETVDCGPGADTAYVDRGVDEVEANCETVVNGFPDVGAASSSRQAPPGAPPFGDAPA